MLEINKIHQGDCLTLMKEISNESVDLIISDPPYKTTARGHAGNSGGMLQKEINKKGMVFNHNTILPEDYARYLFNRLKESGHCYIMTNHVNLINMLNQFTSVGFHFIKSLIWDKGNKIMGQYYMSQFEYILFFRKGKGKKINECGTADLLSIPNKKTKGEDGKNIHDTEKPVKLMEVLIKNSSNEGDLVLDPFMGSGTTALACMNLKRRFIGMELDERYYKIAEKRLDKAKLEILNTSIVDEDNVEFIEKNKEVLKQNIATDDGIPPKPKDLGILPKII